MYGPKIALSVEVTNWPQRLDPITAVQLLDNLVAIKVTDFLFIDIIDALAMATIAVRALALTYCPEIAAELESQQPAQITPGQNQVTNEQSRVTKCTSATRPNLPAGVKDTPGARAAFDSLVIAGYLDSEYKQRPALQKM